MATRIHVAVARSLGRQMRHSGRVNQRADSAPTASELETVFARGWQGTVVKRLGDWLLRAGSGFTGRANSVLPLGSPGRDLDAALLAVSGFYREHGLPPLFQVPIDAGPALADLDERLAERGWEAFNTTAVITARVQELLRSLPARTDLSAAQLDDMPDDRWLAGYLYRGSRLPSTAVDVLVNADGLTFASVRDRGDLLGVARGVVTENWLGITAVTVSEEHRRRGVGTHLMREIVRWGAGRGAESVYLQVDEANIAALAMYRRLGFTRHHGYHYRRLNA